MLMCDKVTTSSVIQEQSYSYIQGAVSITSWSTVSVSYDNFLEGLLCYFRRLLLSGELAVVAGPSIKVV